MKGVSGVPASFRALRLASLARRCSASTSSRLDPSSSLIFVNSAPSTGCTNENKAGRGE